MDPTPSVANHTWSMTLHTLLRIWFIIHRAINVVVPPHRTERSCTTRPEYPMGTPPYSSEYLQHEMSVASKQEKKGHSLIVDGLLVRAYFSSKLATRALTAVFGEVRSQGSTETSRCTKTCCKALASKPIVGAMFLAN